MSIWSSALLKLVSDRISQASKHKQEADVGQQDLQVQYFCLSQEALNVAATICSFISSPIVCRPPLCVCTADCHSMGDPMFLAVLQVNVDELPLESTQMKEVAEMLKDIRKVRAKSLGEQHVSVAEAACVVSLLFICLRDSLQADQHCKKRSKP